MTEFQQRVVAEKLDLDKNLEALRVFLSVNQIFTGLPDAEQGRLRRQQVAMHAYSTVLGERIAAFPQ